MKSGLASPASHVAHSSRVRHQSKYRPKPCGRLNTDALRSSVIMLRQPPLIGPSSAADRQKFCFSAGLPRTRNIPDFCDQLIGSFGMRVVVPPGEIASNNCRSRRACFSFNGTSSDCGLPQFLHPTLRPLLASTDQLWGGATRSTSMAPLDRHHQRPKASQSVGESLLNTKKKNTTRTEREEEPKSQKKRANVKKNMQRRAGQEVGKASTG